MQNDLFHLNVVGYNRYNALRAAGLLSEDRSVKKKELMQQFGFANRKLLHVCIGEDAVEGKFYYAFIENEKEARFFPGHLLLRDIVDMLHGLGIEIPHQFKVFNTNGDTIVFQLEDWNM